MASYKSFNQLNGKTLKSGDTVWFTINGKKYPAHIHSSRLYFMWFANSYIFELLGIVDCASLSQHVNNKEIDKDPHEGPQWEFYDYEAATRFVLVLLAFAEGCESLEVQMPDGSWSPFHYKNYRGDTVIEHTIGDYTTRITRAGVKVGCTHVPAATVEHLYKTMKRLQREHITSVG
jgi:hypothetical protein